MAAAPRHILNAELSTLHQCQGELKTDADGTVGVWAHYLTDDSRLSDNKNVAFKNTLNGMEIGADNDAYPSQFRLDEKLKDPDAAALVNYLNGADLKFLKDNITQGDRLLSVISDPTSWPVAVMGGESHHY